MRAGSSLWPRYSTERTTTLTTKLAAITTAQANEVTALSELAAQQRQLADQIATLNADKEIVLFPATGTRAQFLALIADMTIDVIELSGTYSGLGHLVINIDRTARPLLIRPAIGATAVISGVGLTSGFAYFGLGGVARSITMQDLILDGWGELQDTGLFWTGSASDIALPRMTVRNCGTTGPKPWTGWALYVSDGTSGTNISANDWSVVGSNRTMSGLHVRGAHANIGALRWNVAHLAYVFYDDSSNTDGLTLDGWIVDDSGVVGTPCSVVFTTAVGAYSNFHVTNSLGLRLAPGTGMVDGGGNTWV